MVEAIISMAIVSLAVPIVFDIVSHSNYTSKASLIQAQNFSEAVEKAVTMATRAEVTLLQASTESRQSTKMNCGQAGKCAFATEQTTTVAAGSFPNTVTLYPLRMVSTNE